MVDIFIKKNPHFCHVPHELCSKRAQTHSSLPCNCIKSISTEIHSTTSSKYLAQYWCRSIVRLCVIVQMKTMCRENSNEIGQNRYVVVVSTIPVEKRHGNAWTFDDVEVDAHCSHSSMTDAIGRSTDGSCIVWAFVVQMPAIDFHLRNAHYQECISITVDLWQCRRYILTTNYDKHFNRNGTNVNQTETFSSKNAFDFSAMCARTSSQHMVHTA